MDSYSNPNADFCLSVYNNNKGNLTIFTTDLSSFVQNVTILQKVVDVVTIRIQNILK